MKRTKEELKIVFENGDRPNQEDFWDWQDSYWHKDDDIPKEKIENLNNLLNEKANTNASNAEVEAWQNKLEIDDKINSAIKNINYTWSPTNRTLTLYDRAGNQLSQVSLLSLDNEGTDLRYNASTLSLELWNADNQLLDSIPVSSFIGSVATQLQLNSNQLSLKDSQGNILSTVTFEISNINGLQAALDGKINKPTIFASYPSTSHKFIPVIDSTGDAKKLNLSTILDPKLDKPTMTNNYVGRWSSTSNNFVNGVIQDDGTNVGVGGSPDTNTSPARAKLYPNNGKYFNFPLNNGAINTTLNSGDIFSQYNRLFFRPVNFDFGNNAGFKGVKITGLDIDGFGDFNTPYNFNTFLNSQEDRFGRAVLYQTGLYYGNTIMNAAPTSVGVDSRMYEGYLMAFRRIAASEYQLYFDAKGNIYSRALGGQYHGATEWGRSLLDRPSSTTTLGSDSTYTNIKWAVDSTTQAALIAPRMTQAQRLAITLGTTQEGAVVYQTDGIKGYYLWNGTSWNTLGSNIATADLTNTSARTFTQNASFSWNTLGNPHIVSGLPDKNSDITNFRKVRVQNTSGLDAVVDSKNLLTDGVTSMTDAEKDAWRLAQRKTGETYSTGQPRIDYVLPFVIKREDAIQYIMLQGVNLYVNPATTIIKIVNTATLQEYDVLTNSITVYANDYNRLQFTFNFSTVPIGTYKIKLVNNSVQNIDTTSFDVVDSITSIPINCTWETVQNSNPVFTLHNTPITNFNSIYQKCAIVNNNSELTIAEVSKSSPILTQIQANGDWIITLDITHNKNNAYWGGWFVGLMKSSIGIDLFNNIDFGYGRSDSKYSLIPLSNVNTAIATDNILIEKLIMIKTGLKISLFWANGGVITLIGVTTLFDNINSDVSLVLKTYGSNTQYGNPYYPNSDVQVQISSIVLK